MIHQQYLVLDFETYSEADLKRVGAFEYSMHESTEVLCVGWKLGTRESLARKPTKVHTLKDWNLEIYPASMKEQLLIEYLEDPDVKIVAHNALFEQCIIKNVMGRQYFRLRNLPHNRFICSAALAASYALPRNLEGACLALNLNVKKDMDGRRLILKWCKPRKVSKHNDSRRQTDPDELKRLMAYCGTDVDAETELFLTLPPLIPFEQKIWELDQTINFRGFHTDRPLVIKALQLIAEETKTFTKDIRELTFGEIQSPNQREKILNWFHFNGLNIPNLQKKTVEEYFAHPGTVEPKIRRMLEIRLSASKTSTAKYEAFEKRSRSDWRVRDNLVYHTASTGRWGGAGVQPQNFFRPTLPQWMIEDAIEIMKGR